MVIFYHYPVLPAILGRSIGRALHKATLLPWLTLLSWFLLSAVLRYRQLMYQSHYREGGTHYPAWTPRWLGQGSSVNLRRKRYLEVSRQACLARFARAVTDRAELSGFFR